MSDESVISTELQAARKISGLSRERVASLLGVSAKSIERWEMSGKVGPAQLRALRGVYADVAAGRISTDNDVSRGTSQPTESARAESDKAYSARLRRVEEFKRQMVRVGADDFEADQVEMLGERFVLSMAAAYANHPSYPIDEDEEVDLFLRFGLRPWVIERIERRNPPAPIEDPAEDPVLPEPPAGPESKVTPIGKRASGTRGRRGT